MTVAASFSSASSSSAVGDLHGIVGLAARIIQALGEFGVGLLTLVETVFPPIPSEVILPLAGFLAQQGEMNFVLVFATATLGAYLGGLILYWIGRKVGEERAIRVLSKLPLVDEEDFRRSAGWLHRHGRSAVFFGRLLPGVRSLISLPAGSTGMPLWTFSIFTIAGTAVWNGLLIGLGALLGTQYELIDRYSSILDIVIYAAVAGVLAWLVIRRIRRGRQAKASA
ncbi:DedA family protein [Naasia sp. SYSU D00057]|uniref:DedA family protein n=1 Tax=Naasia sp. SYSU D00057 TaxID=2817380 RepID=UPI001B3157A4|nr:DedA family protein [Naasia sp. SYSU D00057]